MSDLHDRLRAVIEERLALAKAATPGPWTRDEKTRCSISAEAGFRGHVVASVGYMVPGDDRTGWPAEEDAAFIAAHDPADAIRRHEAALRVLERHAPSHDDVADWLGLRLSPDERVICGVSGETWPCDDVRDLAASYGVPVESEASGWKPGDRCDCPSCAAGVLTAGHCVDIDGDYWHTCGAVERAEGGEPRG